MFSQAHRTDYESLLEDCLVKDKDYDEFIELYELELRLPQHDCAKSRFKFLKLINDAVVDPAVRDDIYFIYQLVARSLKLSN